MVMLFRKAQDHRKQLAAIVILAFAIRILPVLLFEVPAGLDAYLHIDIALRILEKGALLSTDPMSLIGLKAYSYPPGFHVLMAFFMLFLPPLLGSHILVAGIGAATAALMYLLTLEIFGDRRISLLSALFMATSPIHIFRTTMPIPEAFGVMLFVLCMLFVVRYMKRKSYKDVAGAVLTFAVYALSHRGWTLLVLTLFLLALVYNIHLFRRKRYLIGTGAFIAVVYFVVTNYFSDLLARINVEAVSALGYFKWMGVVQLCLGAIGIAMLHRTKDRLKLFVAVWASMLLLVGSFSFRFRDPYASIPLAMLSAYAFMEYLLPLFKKDRKTMKRVAALILIVAVVQGFATAIFVVEHPSQEEIDALTWIRDNTPPDSIVLTWKEEGYYIIGISERKDILTWKKIYQGFFDEPPTVDEAKAAYTDMFVMFRSSQKQWMLDLMDRYSVDYVYIDARMRSELDALQYGLVEYLSDDTYFRPVFANDKAEVYEFERQPMVPAEYTGPLTDYMPFGNYTAGTKDALTLVPYIEGYWNGIAYADPRDYRAHYPDNSRIALMYLGMDNGTGTALSSRAEWLLKWLAFEQLPDGSFFDQKYENPKKSAATTCQVISDVIDITEMRPDITEGPSIDRAADFIYSQTSGGSVKTLPTTDYDDYRTDAACLPAIAKLADVIGDARFHDVKKAVLENIISSQNEDGSWQYGDFSDRSTVNSQAAILQSLVEYSEATGDRSLDDAIRKGAVWLSRNQNGKGMFWNYVVEETGRVIATERASYPRALEAYSYSGMEGQENLTLSYMPAAYNPSMKDLEALVSLTDWYV